MWGFFLHIADAATVHKVLKNLDVIKASGRDQISVKCFKDNVPVIAVHLANIINLPTKLDTFPSKCKIAKLKPFFKKGIKIEAKIIFLLLLISKVIEKSIHDQIQDYHQGNRCWTLINLALEKIIPKIHIWFG